MSFVSRIINGKMPQIKNAIYIGDNAVIIGDVRLGKNANIWPNCTIRGDFATIIIGENTNIQDNTVIHVSKYEDENYLKNPKGHVIIGNNTTIGHNCIIHSCIIGSNSLIGMGSIIGDDTIIEDGALVGAGSNITPRTLIKSGELWFGNPAKFMRFLRDDDIEFIKENTREYVELAKSLAKNDVNKNTDL